MNRRHILKTGAFLAGLGAARAADACRVFPETSDDDYVAYQAGRAIGAMRISFTRELGYFYAHTSMEMRYLLQGAVEVEHRLDVRETWRRARLDRVDALADIAGVEYRTEGVNTESGMLIRTSRRPEGRYLSGYLVPTTLWHRDVRYVLGLLDVTHGELVSVRPRFVDRRPGRWRGAPASFDVVAVRGQFNRDAWYAPDCTLARMDLWLRDGTRVSFVHRSLGDLTG